MKANVSALLIVCLTPPRGPPQLNSKSLAAVAVEPTEPAMLESDFSERENLQDAGAVAHNDPNLWWGQVTTDETTKDCHPLGA